MPRALAVVLLLASALPSAGQAPERPARTDALTVTLLRDRTAPRPRRGGPIPLALRIQARAEAPRELTLVAELWQQRRLLGSLRLDVVLRSGLQRVDALFPPIEARRYAEIPVELRLGYEAGETRRTLWRVPFWTPGFDNPLLLVASPPAVGDVDGRARADRVATLRPKVRNPDGTAASPLVDLTHLPVAELPTTPYGYLVCDVLLLDGVALERTSLAARRAIVHWVRAGGCLLAIPGPAPPPEVRIWLGELLARAGGPELTFPLERSLLRHLAAGRIAVLPRIGDPSIVRFLHRFLYPTLDTEEGAEHLEIADFQPTMTTTTHERIPARAAALPLDRVLWIFVGFVLLVGPLDYLVTRRLRRRWLTWFTLPILSLAATAAILTLTDQAYSGADTRRGVVFEDYAPDGRLTRRRRYTVLFPPRSGTEVLPSTGVTTLFEERFQDSVATARLKGLRRLARRPPGQHDVEPIAYRGRLGAPQSTLSFSVRQWQPGILHTLELPPDLPDEAFDWTAIRLTSGGASPPAELTAALSPHIPPRSAAMLYLDGGWYDIPRIRRAIHPRSEVVNLVHWASVGTRCAPRGDARLTDLRLLPTDSTTPLGMRAARNPHPLLIVIREEAGDLVIRRILLPVE